MPDVKRYRRTKEMPCRGCGRPMTVDVQTRNSPRCLDCGVGAAVAAARQMHDKAGPAWERWLASNANKGRGRGRITPSG